MRLYPAAPPSAGGAVTRTSVPAGGPTGPDLLAYAAGSLPAVACAGPVLAGELHAALFDAARRLRGAAAEHAHRLADEATDMFVAYLVGTGRAAPDLPLSDTLRGWLRDRHIDLARLELGAAAAWWRQVLAYGEPPSTRTRAALGRRSLWEVS